MQLATTPPRSPPSRRGALLSKKTTINTLMQKQSSRGRLASSLGHKALHRNLSINPWNLRRGQDSTDSSPLQAQEELPIRVILHSCHPWSTEAHGMGKLVALPDSLQELLQVAGTIRCSFASGTIRKEIMFSTQSSIRWNPIYRHPPRQKMSQGHSLVEI